MARHLLLVAAALAATAHAVTIVSEPSTSDDVRLRRATLEARRYLYELSGELPKLGTELLKGDDGGSAPRVLVANADRLAHIHPQLVDDGSPPPREPGSHFVQLVNLAASEGNTSNASGSSGVLIVCSGVDSTATLYAVYSLLELLGVRFRNHGDIIPRNHHGKGLAALLSDSNLGEAFSAQREWASPNMVLRGSQVRHSSLFSCDFRGCLLISSRFRSRSLTFLRGRTGGGSRSTSTLWSRSPSRK